MSRHDVVAKRREDVAALLVARKTVREIAAELKTPTTTVQRDIEAVRGEWRDLRMTSADEVIAQELAALGYAESRIMGAVTAGDLMAVDRLLRIMERRAKLLGLDAPKRIDITERVRRIAEEAGIDPDEAVREAERITKALP